MSTEDGELIAGFQPGPARWVAAFAFETLEDAIWAQEKLSSKLCGWTDQGDRYDRVETLMMAQGQIGERAAFDGDVVLKLLVTTRASLQESERLRRAWAQHQMQAVAPRTAKLALSESWKPSSDQVDFFDKWCEEVVELDPAGVEQGKRRRTGHVRNGFNVFVKDHGRPDLQFLGTPGGRAFSALLRSRFGDDFDVRQSGGNNTYYHGLQRRSGANPAWFPK